MNETGIFCPGCEAPNVSGSRFCRRCGISLQVGDRPPSDRQAEASVVRPSSRGEASFKELKSNITWTAIRGVVTLLIAVPSFLLVTFATLASGSWIMLLPWLVILVFMVLGYRDLSKSYGMLKNPGAALSALNEKRSKAGADRLSIETSRLDYSSIKKVGAEEPPPGPVIVSITEDTTFPLRDGIRNEVGDPRQDKA